MRCHYLKTIFKGFLGNTYVDGQENGYAFNHFVNPLQVKSEAAVADEMKKVPPVILFIILLISSLLIGFYSHQIQRRFDWNAYRNDQHVVCTRRAYHQPL